MKRLTIAAAALCIAANAIAQDEPKLTVKPSGRILMDGAMISASDEIDKDLNDGFGVPDLRIGMKATYGQWEAKVDVGYAYNKVGLKDVHLQYTFDKQNFLRAGYFIHQFGLQSATSSSFKESMEEPHSNQAFNNSRMLGVMYQHTTDKWLATASLFTENDAMKMSTDKLGNEAVGIMTRQVWKPRTAEGDILHAGMSVQFESARYNSDEALNHKSYSFKSTWPTRVASVTAQQATVDNVKNVWKLSPELLIAKKKLALQAQYFYVLANREDGYHNYHASGAYGTVRAIVKGGNYKYTHNDGGLATPDPKSWELVAQYNYTDMNTPHAEIYGGILNDWSLTMNHYLNKYMIWRVRASYTDVVKRAGHDNNHASILETRLQIKF